VGLMELLCILAAGATAISISPRAVWQFDNAFKCSIPWISKFTEYNYYGCYCAFVNWNDRSAELDRCCKIHDNCYAQVKKMESCKFLIRNPYSSPYSYSCSGREITCSDENDPCEDFICNCDRQAAICISKTSYNKDYQGDHC
uniref:Phospholipase A2 n=1 Tax=Peromyscus maniculatus bairdii TaxID=230844 RepID=A0A8C8W7P4_PERMB